MLKAIVKRPDFDEDDLKDPEVKLTATVKSGSVVQEFDKIVKVRRQGLTGSRAVILDLNAIEIPTQVKNNIDLVSIGSNGSSITWTTSNASAISATGDVIRADTGVDDVVVTLTATCEKGEDSQTKEFEVTVLSWTKEDELADAISKVNWDLIKKDNEDSQAIETDLNLPSTIGRNVAAKWSTVTSKDYIDIDTGVITRPSYTQGQVTLLLTCTLTQDGTEHVVNLPAYIINPLDMTKEEVVAYAKNNLESKSFLGDNPSSNEITKDMYLPYSFSYMDSPTVSISWDIATSPEHGELTDSKYVDIVAGMKTAIAKITRPSKTDGNQHIALKASISAGSTSDSAKDTKYFDLIILADEENTTDESTEQ